MARLVIPLILRVYRLSALSIGWVVWWVDNVWGDACRVSPRKDVLTQTYILFPLDSEA